MEKVLSSLFFLQHKALRALEQAVRTRLDEMLRLVGQHRLSCEQEPSSVRSGI